MNFVLCEVSPVSTLAKREYPLQSFFYGYGTYFTEDKVHIFTSDGRNDKDTPFPLEINVDRSNESPGFKSNEEDERSKESLSQRINYNLHVDKYDDSDIIEILDKIHGYLATHPADTDTGEIDFKVKKQIRIGNILNIHPSVPANSFTFRVKVSITVLHPQPEPEQGADKKNYE